MRRLLGLAALLTPCVVLFAAFMLAGCATAEPGKRDFTMVDGHGETVAWIKPTGKIVYAPGKNRDGVVVALIQMAADLNTKLAQRTEELAAALALVPKTPEHKPVEKDEGMEKLAEKAACETDAELAADPETPDDIRVILYKALAKCRTNKQGEAFDRMADASRTLEPMAKSMCSGPEGEMTTRLRDACDKAGLLHAKPLPQPSLLRKP